MQKKAGPAFYLFLVGFVFVILFPFLWQFLASLKPPGELFGESTFKLFASNPTLDNYVRVFTLRPFGAYLWNSFVVASLTTVYCVFVAAIAAYAIARLHFRGHVNRLLRGLVLDRGDVPAGATLWRGDKQVGDVRSPVVSPRFGPIAIAMIRREVAIDDVVEVRDGETRGSARVVDLPFA